MPTISGTSNSRCQGRTDSAARAASIVSALISAGGMASILPAITLVGSAAPKGIHARRIVNPTLSRDLVIARKASRELTDAGEAFAGLLASRVQKSQMPA